MFGVDDALLGAGLSAAANLGGSFMSAGGASAQNATNLEINRENMAAQQVVNEDAIKQAAMNRAFQHDEADIARRFQSDMSNTAYQRAMADMKAAGLNPMLAYSQGGASTGNVAAPSGNVASGMSAPTLHKIDQNPGAEMGRGLSRVVSSAVDTFNTIQSARNAVETNNKIKAEVINTQADTDKKKAEAIATMHQGNLTKEQIANIPWIRDMMKAQTSSYGAQAGLFSTQTGATQQDERRKTEFGDSWLGQQLNTLQQFWKKTAPQTEKQGHGGEPVPKVKPPSNGWFEIRPKTW